MSKVLSTAAINFLNGEGSTAELFRNMVGVLYTGTQPAAGTNATGADSACTGTPLLVFTAAAGVITREVRATAVLDFTGITTGETVTGITVGGVQIMNGTTVTYATSATATAAAIAANINAALTYPNFSATASGAKVTIKAPKNSGASLNGLAVVAAGTAIAAHCAINAGDDDNLGQTPSAGEQVVGVTAANMLSIAYPATAGSSAKESAAWQGVGGSASINTALGVTGFTGFTTGTQVAGYVRFYMNPSDPEINSSPTPTDDTTYIYPRLDMAASDLTITGGTSITFGATNTMAAFTAATPSAAT